MKFAEPRDIKSRESCSFYQSFDWPDGSVVDGTWDYRDDPEGCLGGVNFAGKSVLELGPASGYLTMPMERLGADVVCIDTDPDYAWDVVPRRDDDSAAYASQRAQDIHKLHDSWWATWNAFKLQARIAYIGASRLREVEGEFDIGLIASILQHFENPYVVMSEMARLCKTIVITEPVVPRLDNVHPMIEFAPNADNEILDSWYLMNAAAVEQMMRTLRFEKVDGSKTSYPLYHERRMPGGSQDAFLTYTFGSQVFTEIE